MALRLTFLPLAALLCGAALPAAQNASATSAEQALHQTAVRTERSARFFAALVTAEDPAREAAEAFLGEVQRASDALGRRPSLVELEIATRLLGGARLEDARSELARFADGLDLEVVPGAFAAESTGLGAPLAVTVYRLQGNPPARDVELSLEWIAPDGARTRARSEPFGAQAFRAPGFRMFVRAPLSEPAVWRLVPIVRAGGLAAEGAPVPVECVADLDARAARARVAEPPAGVDAAAARGRLERLLRAGLRAPEGSGATPSLLPFEDPAAPAWRLTAAGAGGPELYGGFADAHRAGALVFLLTEGEAEELPLAGPVGDAWRALARTHGLGLFTLRLKVGDAAGLRQGLAEVARLAGADPILVARGRTLLSAALLFAAAGAEGPLPLSGLVAQSSAPGIPRLLPPVPVLAIAPGAPPAKLPRDMTFEQGPDVSFPDELRLPAVVAEWLRR